jgi:type II secretory pathway predicted ATPase ExeA
MIVDEAQNLPKDALEELRMLSNFEMAGKSCQTAWKNGQGIRENSVENCPP